MKHKTMILFAWLAMPLFLACSQANTTPTPDAGSASTAESPDAGPIEGKSLTEALAMAETEGKNLLVEYWDPSCPWCKKMDGQTLSDASVKVALGKVMHVRLQKGTSGEAFEARWGQVGTPSYVVMKSDGSVPGSVVTGLVAKQDFLQYLAWAETTNGPEPSLTKGGS